MTTDLVKPIFYVRLLICSWTRRTRRTREATSQLEKVSIRLQTFQPWAQDQRHALVIALFDLENLTFPTNRKYSLCDSVSKPQDSFILARVNRHLDPNKRCTSSERFSCYSHTKTLLSYKKTASINRAITNQ